MKIKLMVLIASMLVVPAAVAADTRVLGEKLDSGLGALGPNYAAWEFMPAGSVRGESLDSGLGDLGRDYTAWEFMPAGSLLGESLDSGLGSLTREDMEKFVRTSAMLRTALDR